jgi:hypothetical protein
VNRLGILRLGDYPGLSGWVLKLIIKVFVRDKESKEEVRDVTQEVKEFGVVQGKGHKPRNACGFQKLESRCSSRTFKRKP